MPSFSVEATKRRSKSTIANKVLPAIGVRSEPEIRVGLENTSEIVPTLLESDYNRLRAEGYTGAWFYAVHESGQRDVRIEHNSKHLSVAKLILGVSECSPVAFKDGSCLNLHPSNLNTS